MDESYRPFCTTERQEECLSARIKYGSNTKAAAHLGVTRRAVDKTLKRVLQQHDRYHGIETPTGFNSTGTSTLKDAEGNVIMRWEKTAADKEHQLEVLRIALEAMKEDIKPCKREPSLRVLHGEDLLNQYLITDYHFGQKSWGEECGEDWDLDIAEELLLSWFAASIAASPVAKTALLVLLGDLLHWDGLDAITPANKFILDADTRFPKVVRVTIRVVRGVVKMLLNKFEHVHVIVAEGNHDPASSVWLRESMAVLYSEEPRVDIDISPGPYYCYQHDNTALFYHHGHKARMSRIDRVFASEFRKVYGATEHAYGHTGHFHSRKVEENELMEVEQHTTLATRDAYSARLGFISGRSAKRITYHKKYGKVGEDIMTPAMLKGLAEA